MPQKPKSRQISHAVGGPSTSRGRDYQIYYAVYRALELIIGHFGAPHKLGAVTLEPRVVDHMTGAVSAWDILTSPDPVTWEAKLVATKQDVIEWMERVGHAGSEEHRRQYRFGLVYGQAKTPLVSALARLRDVAIECGEDGSKFEILTSDNDLLEAVRASLGSDFRRTLRQLVFEPAPEALLRNQTRDRARFLAGEDYERLLTFLFHHFSEGAAQRSHFEISELIGTIRQQAIHLTAPPGRQFAEVSPFERRALLVLAACPAGLLRPALASALGTAQAVLEEKLKPFVSHKLIVEDGDILRFAGIPPGLVQEDLDLLAASLDGLLEWLLQNEVADAAELVARGAIRPADVALKVRPGLALKLFQATEHVIKNLGDKHLLLHVSEMCIHAANDPSAVDRDLKAKAKAQAMLCGHSWIYQRTHRLAEAEVWAQKSERLGESIGWGRNTAFARKCRGRISRILAEQTQAGPQRTSQLKASEELLRDATTLFASLPEYGPVHRQVGDCHSLLGRTAFVAGDLNAAKESAQRAYEILTPSAIKEYFDLLILTGDIESAKGNHEAAERHYSQVIDSHHQKDRELSEICARALRRRGETRAKTSPKPAALGDLRRAAEIWRSLDEHESAADADWRRMQLEGQINRDVLRMFSEVTPLAVRVGAIAEYLDRLKSVKVLARRSLPTKSQVQQLAQAVGKRVAEEHPDW